jgi:hypothetical protein
MKRKLAKDPELLTNPNPIDLLSYMINCQKTQKSPEFTIEQIKKLTLLSEQ